MTSDTPPRADGPEPAAPGDFFGWLRGLGISRDGDRWLAGVAGGIAGRLGIDPIIVRGVFVVFAVFGGPGLLLYALGWLLLPGARGRIHVEEIIRGRSETWVIVVGACVAAALLLPVVFGAGVAPLGSIWLWDAWGIPAWVHTFVSIVWWVAVIAAAVWFTVWIATRSKAGASDGGRSFEETATAFSERAAAWGERTGEKAGAWGERVGAQAGEWGERVGTQAGEWGERVGKQAEEWAREHRLGPAQVIFTFAFAFIAAAAAWYWASTAPALLGDGAGSTPLTVALIAAVSVFAISMVIAGARGKFSGTVGFTAIVGVIALTFTAVIPQGTSFVPFGSHTFSPADSPAGVSAIAGTVRADLTDRDASAHDDAEVWQAAGDTVVVVGDQPTVLDIGILGGSVRVDEGRGESQLASGAFISRRVELGMDRRAGTVDAEDIVHLRIRLAFGNVDIDTDGSTRITELEESR